jgi:hypothetical protein
LLELVARVTEDVAHSLGALVCKSIIANSAPQSIMHDLETAHLSVTINHTHVFVRFRWASREETGSLTLADLTSRSAAIAAHTHIHAVLAVSLTPRTVLAVACIAFVPSALYLFKPYLALAATEIFDSQATKLKAHGLAQCHCTLVRESCAANRAPVVLEFHLKPAAPLSATRQHHSLGLAFRAKVFV